MHTNNISLLLLSLFLTIAGYSSAQVIYPVTASVQTSPPHSGSLADLVAPASNKLSLILNLQDADELSYQVRLRITIEGNGITLTTRNELNFAPLEITYGSPGIFREMDLQEYFDPAAFNFTGYTLNEYLNNGGLPDGFYTICIEALDYLLQNEGPASNQTCTVINASQLDPPVIQTPIGTINNIVDPQNMAVNWINMHNVAIPVEHELEVYTWPYASSLTPEQVVQFDLPFFSTTIMSTTSYVITPADPPLEAGERYLIRVRAQDLSMNYLFKNQGWSEIQVFAYGDACPAPVGLAADSVSTEDISISWLAPNNNTNTYTVRYREKIDGSNWYEDDQSLTEHKITGLADNTTYEIQVQTLCGGTTPGLLTDIIEVKTDSFEFDPTTFECGDDAIFPEITNQTPISANQIAPGDWITVGGFQAKITSISPGRSPGSFNGSCHVKIDWLGFSFTAMFKNLYINTDRVVFDGNIVCTTGGLKSLAGFVPPDSVKIMQETSIGLCGDTITTDSATVAGTFNANAYDVLIPNTTFDKYNPYNKRAPYDPSDYNDPNNPYTEQNPYDETNEWNPHNSFNPYDPFDYDDPANPYTADDPYIADEIYLRTPSATGSVSLAGGARSLPFGLSSQGVNGQEYMIALDKMAFTTNGAIMNAYISLPIPKPGGGVQFASFMLRGVRFHAGGLIGINKLVLTTDVSFNLGSKAVVTLEGGKNSFVSFDCHGFTGVSVKGKVVMCRDVLLPIDWEGKGIDSSGFVTGYFYATMPEWGQWVSDLSITPFEVPGLEDWAFVVENAVFDFSELVTPASVNFPKGYNHPDVTGTKGIQNPEWTGFYLKALRVRLPKKFNKGTAADSTQTDSLAVPPPDTTGFLDSADVQALNARVYDDNQLELGVQDVIIDDTGLTLYVYGSNILTLDEGRVGQWGFAIDSVGIGVQSNQFKKAFLKGAVDVPALSTALGYHCLIEPARQYNFTVTIRDTLTINAFAASVSLTSGSSITLEYIEKTKRWDGIATLNGFASVNANMSTDSSATADTSSRLQLPSLQFQNLKFMTKAPYVNVGSWGLTGSGQGSASNFPVMINQIGMFQNTKNTHVAFVIDASLNLTPNDDNGSGFGCHGKMGIISRILTDTVTQRQDWVFERVRVDEFGLQVSTPAFRLQGEIKFYENVINYGTGFRASITVEVQPALTVEAVAQFGEINGMRYFFVDAFASFNPGIILGASGMAIYGVGGGISYKMKRQGFNGIDLPSPDTEASDPPDPIVMDDPTPNNTGIAQPPDRWFDPRFGRNMKPLPAGTDPNTVPPDQRLGLSLSGMRFTPDENSGIGIRVMLAAGAVKREVFYGKVTLSINLTSSGGLQSVRLEGDLSFLTPPGPGGKTDGMDPAIRATIDMLYDNDKKSFYARLGIYVNTPGNIVKGAYPQGLAGIGVIYADPQDWYVHLGTPTKPVKLVIDYSGMLDGVKDKSGGGGEADSIPGAFQNNPDSLDTAQGGINIGAVGLFISAYFDFGTIIPDFPPLPDEVTSVLGAGYNLTTRDDPALSNGGGIIFGARYAAELSDLRFLFFFADFYAGVGFDVMMRDYGVAARCDGVDTDGPVGINGWYATGQAYAYVLGDIGLFINLFGSEKKFSIIRLGLAAVLQGRLPNPIWLRGIVGGYYSILGGLISGQCSFKFEIGEECNIIGLDSPASEFITDVSPKDSDTDVSVFARPRVSFSAPLDKEFFWTNMDDDTKYYRARLVDFRVTDDGVEIPGTISYNDEKTVLAFKPTDVLPGNTALKIEVTVIFETKDTYVDPWLPLFDPSGQEAKAEATATFTTGEAPNFIPESNVAYSYPVKHQLYFLKDESPTGYIQLNVGQPYLFTDIDLTKWQQKIIFVQNGVPTTPADYTYDAAARRVNFNIPSGELLNSRISQFKLVNIPIGNTEDIDADLDSLLVAYVADPNIPDSLLSGVSANIRETKLSSTSEELKVTSLFSRDFRTSMHNTWTDKVNSFNVINPFYLPMFISDSSSLTINEFGAEIEAIEEFDKFEITGFFNGSEWIAPLVSPEAVLTATPANWFGDIQNTMYDHVPSGPIQIDWRDIQIFGSPPDRGVIARTYPAAQQLEDYDIVTDDVQLAEVTSSVRYRVPYVSMIDFNELRQDVAYMYANDPNPPPYVTPLIQWSYPYPPFGDYDLKLSYRLPGATTNSSSVLKTISYGN